MIELVSLFDLTEKNLLNQIADSIPKIQGEINNKKIIFLSCISKDLPTKFREGLSIVVSSKSSAGKSTLIENCLKPFEKDLFRFTEFTQSFYQRHFKDKSLNGMILHQEQAEKTNFSGQVKLSIPKFQLSEGKTSYGLSERDKDGKFTDTVLDVSGFPIYITSTTNPDIEPQELNRITLLQSDESEQQTKKILESILKAYSNNLDNYDKTSLEELTKLCDIFKDASKQVKDIIIPFQNLLLEKFPKTLEMRRDIKKILNYTCVIAFIHQKRRKKIRVIENKIIDAFGKTEPSYKFVIIADLDDFKECLEIGKDIFSQTLNKVNNSTKEIIEIVKELYEREHKPINSADILKVKNIKQNHANELLRQGHTAGFLSRTKEGRENYYAPTNKKLDVIDVSSIEFTELDIQKWYKENFDDSKYELV